jgi:hypothetical protein
MSWLDPSLADLDFLHKIFALISMCCLERLHSGRHLYLASKIRNIMRTSPNASLGVAGVL